jgi:hypothetical protein
MNDARNAERTDKMLCPECDQPITGPLEWHICGQFMPVNWLITVYAAALILFICFCAFMIIALYGQGQTH